LNIDISQNEAKSVNEFVEQKFDYVVTVCDGAREACPFFPGAREHLHRSFADPSTFEGTEEEILSQVKEVRDKIQEWIEKTF
jgi:arsenate reductase